MVIKPSGVSYEDLSPDKLVIVDLDGKGVEGSLNPSSDNRTHVILYRAFAEVGGIVHTHSTHAVAWAQAGHDILYYGTMHADYFCYTLLPQPYRKRGWRGLRAQHLRSRCIDISKTGDQSLVHTGVICRNHGPFAWGGNSSEAGYHAVVLEEFARMGLLTLQADPSARSAPQHVIDKHFQRKHGPNAYYGQR